MSVRTFFKFSYFSPFLGVTLETDGMCNISAAPSHPVFSLVRPLPYLQLFFLTFYLNAASPLQWHLLSIPPFPPNTSPSLTPVHCVLLLSSFLGNTLTHVHAHTHRHRHLFFCSHQVSSLFVSVQVCPIECVFPFYSASEQAGASWLNSIRGSWQSGRQMMQGTWLPCWPFLSSPCFPVLQCYSTFSFAHSLSFPLFV